MEKILVVEANALLNPITGLLTFDTATKNCTEIQQAVIQSNYETIPVFIAHLFIEIGRAHV